MIKKALWVVLAGFFLGLMNSEAQNKPLDPQFIAVSSYLIFSSVFDTETTFASLHNGCHEANPVMRPFVKSGRAATYAFVLATDAAVIYVAYRMRKCENPGFKKIWWVGPMVIGTGHAVAGGVNCGYIW
jgi:hypothetical protein